jgi:hypothetical protein
MKISRSVLEQTKEQIFSNPNWGPVLDVAVKNNDGQLYLVGGRLYRTLIEVMYGYPCRSECVDWDFATTKVKENKYWPKLFTEKEKPGYPGLGGPESNRIRTGSIHLSSRRGGVDIINIPDIIQVREERAPKNIHGYLDSVPLTIQSIALDLANGTLVGDAGIESLLSKRIWVHNMESYASLTAFKNYPSEMTYIVDKQGSLKFSAALGPAVLDELKMRISALKLEKYAGQGFTPEQIKAFPGKMLRVRKRSVDGIVTQATFEIDEWRLNREWKNGKWSEINLKKKSCWDNPTTLIYNGSTTLTSTDGQDQVIYYYNSTTGSS